MEDPVVEIPTVIRLLTQSVPSVQKQTIERYFTTSASFTHPFCRTGSFPGSRWFVLQFYRFYKIMSPGIEIEVKSITFDQSNLTLFVAINQVFRLWVIPFYSESASLVTVLKLSEGLERQPASSPGPAAAAAAAPYSPSPHPRPRSDRHIQFQAVPPSPLSRQTSSSGETTQSDDELPSPRRKEHQTPSDHSPPPSSPPPLNLPTQQPQQEQQQEQQPLHPRRRLYYISSQEDLYQTSEFIKFVAPFGIGAGVVLLWHAFATLFCVLGAVFLRPVSWAEEKGYMPLRGQGPRNISEAEAAVLRGGRSRDTLNI